MGVNFSQAWANKSLCKVALSVRKRDYPIFPSPSCQFSSQNAVLHERLPPPLPSEGERNCGGSRGPWQDGEKCWLQHIGKWAIGPDAERPGTGCSPPPSPFSKQVPFKFTPFTSCPRRSPAPGAWFPLCRYGCPPHKQVWYWRRGCARPRRRCLRSPVWPGCG